MNPSEYEIEKGQPIPINKRGGPYVDFLRKMEVGDSAELPNLAAAKRMQGICIRAGGKAVYRKQPSGLFRFWLTQKLRTVMEKDGKAR